LLCDVADACRKKRPSPIFCPANLRDWDLPGRCPALFGMLDTLPGYVAQSPAMSGIVRHAGQKDRASCVAAGKMSGIVCRAMLDIAGQE
jgi:hypothetical protein